MQLKAELAEKLKQKFPTLSFAFEGTQAVARIAAPDLREVLQFCRDDAEFAMSMLMDIVGVDDWGKEEPRFELVYILFSLKTKQRLQLKLRVAEDQSLATVSDLYACADWAEREVYDMFGIRFEGHPNLKRILMFEGFEGHPLRKDYPIRRRQKIPQIEEVP